MHISFAGYIIFYTTDSSKKDRDWAVEAIKGDKHSYIIHNLLPSTTYYFKIQARNSRGYGPISSIVQFKTGESKFISVHIIQYSAT